MKYKILTIYLILAGFSFSSNGQTPLLERTVQDYSKPGKKGPNLRFYNYEYLGLGFIIPLSDTTAKISVPGSFSINLGFRQKWKVANFFSLGIEENIALDRYSIKQTSAKVYPDTLHHKTEAMSFEKFGLGFYSRFNFGRRGNYIGKFLDIGIRGNWYAQSIHSTKDKINNSRETHRSKGMKYYEPLNYEVFCRLGWNRIALTGTYRMSKLMKSEYYVKELPPLTIGMEIGLY
jgi:hypothetical protein